VRVGNVDYSVPPGLARRRVQVRVAPREVVVHLEGSEIARHGNEEVAINGHGCSSLWWPPDRSVVNRLTAHAEIASDVGDLPSRGDQVQYPSPELRWITLPHADLLPGLQHEESNDATPPKWGNIKESTKRGAVPIGRLSRWVGSGSVPSDLVRQLSSGTLMIDVFISHSNEDAPLAEMLVDLLRSALNLGAETIRASSVDGYRLPGGAEVDEQLRDELLGAPIFIGIVSPLSLSSAYVLFELGARWGAGTQLIPLLAPGMTAHALPGPIAGLNALRCESPPQLHQLVQQVGKVLRTISESPAVYQAKIDAIASLGVAAGAVRGPRNSEAGAEPRESKNGTSAEGPSDRAVGDDDYSDAEVMIRHHCDAAWPEDYSMRAYCVQEQRKALAVLRKGTPQGVPSEVFGQIRRRCAAEWPDDYAMRAYCEGRQVEGYKQTS
jgi:Mu transposase-like protein/TIR domain-containing protein